MAPKKSKGQGAKTAAGIAGDVDAGACKLHVAMARPGINVSAKSTADSIMEALKQDIADGNTEAVNKPIPRSGVTVLQLAITSGAGQLVKRMLAENVFDIPQMEKTNLDDGKLPLLHEAVKSGSEDVLNAMLEKLQTTADACNNRAVMLEKFLRTYGDDCGPRTFQMKNGSTAVSAIAAAAMLCHGFPMELVLTELTKAFASVMSSNEADAAAVAKSAEALTPVCPAIMQKVTEAAASMVTSPASVAAVPIPQAYWLSASAVLIAREKPLTECGFDSSVLSSPHLMAVHMSTPPKGLELTRMLPSQFYTFWASLNTDFAASESALEHFLAAGQQFGLEALYLARAIPDACPLREKWINACVPPASAGTTLGSLLAASIHVPSPLKLNVAPAEFERIWFPSCAVEEAEGGDEAAGGDGDAVEEYRSEIWRKFMLSRDVPVLSAVLAEGMAGDGKVVQALLASATGTDEDEHTLSREVYDSCNSVPDVVGAALRQVEAEPGAAVPLAEWRVESMQGGGDVPLSENCTCTPMLEFVQSVNRWEDAEDARLALEALVSKARTLSGPALSGAPVCNLMPWTSDLLPVPGSADTSEDGKPIVPGAEHLSSTASQADVDLGRALVGAASGIVAGRGLPDPGGQRTAPIAFKVLQWLLNLDGAALLAMREQLGFPFHLRGLDQDSGDLLIEALWGTSPDVLHLIVQHIADNDFKATADWADVNMAALACFRGWSEGVAAVLAVPSVDPMAPINDAGDTPLHWLCKAGSSWADVTVGGKSVDIYAATTALMAPGELKPSQIRGVVTELAAYKDGAMANAVDAASRTPLFYAHSPAAIEALLDAGADVNARDCDGLDCVAFRITETMALDTDKFDLSVKDQIRAIVAHHDYNHQAHFEIKSENAQAGGADDDGGSAVCCVEKYAADHCPLDRDIELILHTTSAMKDIYRIRLPDVPRSKISNHVRTWMAFISKKEFCKNDLHTGDLLVKLEQTEPNLRRRFLSAFRDFCKFPKEKLQQWDAESAMYYMDKLQKGIDDGKIPLEGHNHTICFAETMLEDVNERFGREALKTVLGFGKADWDEAITFMQPECQCDDPEHDHPTVTLYEFLRDKRGVAVKELPDPTKETPGCTVPLAQKKKHKLLPAPDAPSTVPLLESSSAPKSKVKSGFKRGFFGKAPEKSEVTTGKDSGKARPAWVEKCSTYGSDVLKGIEKTEMRKRIVACMGHKDAKAKDENGAIKRLLAFYDSSVDVRSASMADVSSIAMPPKTKPSLKFAQWLKAEGTEFMAQAKKKEKPKTLGPPIPDNHKFAPLKSTMWEGAWTMYYLSCCALLDAMANGKDALGKANFTTAGDEYCKALSNMAQACLSAAATGKDYQRGDKITQAQLREMLMSAVSTATAALACSNISNMDGLELKNLRRLRSALSMLADDTQSEQARQASKSMEAYVADKEKEAKQAAAT